MMILSVWSSMRSTEEAPRKAQSVDFALSVLCTDAAVMFSTVSTRFLPPVDLALQMSVLRNLSGARSRAPRFGPPRRAQFEIFQWTFWPSIHLWLENVYSPMDSIIGAIGSDGIVRSAARARGEGSTLSPRGVCSMPANRNV